MSKFLESFKKRNNAHDFKDTTSEQSLSGDNTQEETIENFEPFTALDYEQVCSFVSTLAFEKKVGFLSETEKSAFEGLTYTAFGSLDGEMGTYRLKFGKHPLFVKENIHVDYEKVESMLDYDEREGRTTIKISTHEGGLLIQQHQRNKGIFLLWITSPISKRLKEAFMYAESKALDLSTNNPAITSGGVPELND